MPDLSVSVILSALGILAGIIASHVTNRNKVDEVARGHEKFEKRYADDQRDQRATDQRQAEQIGHVTARLGILEALGTAARAAPPPPQVDTTGSHRALPRSDTPAVVITASGHMQSVQVPTAYAERAAEAVARHARDVLGEAMRTPRAGRRPIEETAPAEIRARAHAALTEMFARVYRAGLERGQRER